MSSVMKAALRASLVAGLLVAFGVQISSAQVGVQLPDTTAEVGDSLVLPVQIENVDGEDITSFEFTLPFDSTVVKITGAHADSAITPSAPTVNATGTEIKVSFASAQALSGSGALLHLEAEVGQGRDSLQFKNFQLFDSSANEVASETTPGEITVGEGGGSESATISGEAVAPDGTTLPGMRVTATGADTSYTTTTGEDGSYSIEVEPGTFGLSGDVVRDTSYLSVHPSQTTVSVDSGDAKSVALNTEKGYHLGLRNVQFQSREKGPLSVSPGESLTLEFEYTSWSRSANPGSVIYAAAGLEGDAQSAASLGIPGGHPGESGSASVGLAAPTESGTYTVNVVLAPKLSESEALSFYDQKYPNSFQFISVASVEVRSTDDLSPPTSVSASAGDRSVELVWNPGSEDTSPEYNVYRNTSSFSDVAGATKVTTSPISDTSYIDRELTNGETYYYRVTAVNSAGDESGPSNEVSAMPQSVDLSDGLAASYPFNGDAKDTSGNGHDGIVSGAVLTTDRFGNEQSAYDFDGQDDYINLGSTSSILSGSSFSLSLWVRIDSASDGGNRQILSSETYYENYGDITLNSDEYRFYTGNNLYSTLSLNDSVKNGNWHHVALVHDGGSGSLFVDGNEVDRSSLDEFSVSSEELHVGASIPDRYTPIDGSVDDVRLYDRPLSEAEIQELHDTSGATNTGRYALGDGYEYFVTDREYDPETEDIPNLIDEKYGSEAELAEWNDLKNQLGGDKDSLVAFLNGTGMTERGDHAFVTRGGNRFYSGDRHYYMSRHNGDVPGNYLVHDQMHSNTVSLGSWYTTKPALVRLPVKQSGFAVWPGDTDNDGTVDQADVLPLGLYWGNTGPARTETNCSWQGWSVSAWSTEAATYADANGDGTVDQADVLCVGLNWGETRDTSTASLLAGTKKTEDPAGQLTIRRADRSGSTVWVELYAEDVTSLMGVAAELSFDPDVVSIETVEPGSRMGGGALLQSNVDDEEGTLGVGISRKGSAVKATGDEPIARVKLQSSTDRPGIGLREGRASAANGTTRPLATDNSGLKPLPEKITLTAPAPHPVHRQATLTYTLPGARHVRLTIYDMLGRKVRVLVDGRKKPGRKQVAVDASDLSAGTYFYRLKAGEKTKTERLTVVR